MRRLLALAGALALVGLTSGTALASPATVGPGEFLVFSNYWGNPNGNMWAESIPNHNWYISPTNATDINVPNSASWQEYQDAGNIKLCITLDWANGGATDKLLDETCANHPSQLWASHTFGDAQTWYLYNQYLTPSRAGCANGHQAVIDAPSPTAGLTMRCVQTNGNPLPEQLWGFISG